MACFVCNVVVFCSGNHLTCTDIYVDWFYVLLWCFVAVTVWSVLLFMWHALCVLWWYFVAVTVWSVLHHQLHGVPRRFEGTCCLLVRGQDQVLSIDLQHKPVSDREIAHQSQPSHAHSWVSYNKERNTGRISQYISLHLTPVKFIHHFKLCAYS